MEITTVNKTKIDGKIVQAFSLLHNSIKVYGQETIEIPYSMVGEIKVNGTIKVKDGVLLTSGESRIFGKEATMEQTVKNIEMYQKISKEEWNKKYNV